MNTPKEPSAVERAIEAQRQAHTLAYRMPIHRDYLAKPEQLAALFAVQNLYAKLEKKHSQTLAEIAALREDFTKTQRSLIENAAARIKELDDELRAVQRALGGGARYESIERLFTK